MKVGRVVGAVLLLLLLAGIVRAIYLHRLWTIARIWVKSPPTLAPSPVAFFLPGAWGSTAHNVYADVVFLKVRGSTNVVEGIATQTHEHETHSSARSTPDNPCGDPDWFRVNPDQIAPENLATCYGVAGKFGASDNGTGHAFQREGNVGGYVSTDANGYLFLAVYRIR